MSNTGAAAIVLHVYDRLHLDRTPRRYTLGASADLTDAWDLTSDAGAYDLWVLGPNGFHRHFAGRGPGEVSVAAKADPSRGLLLLTIGNAGPRPVAIEVSSAAYEPLLQPWRPKVAAGRSVSHAWALEKTGGWYDLTVATVGQPGSAWRLAGRIETGRDTISDPAMGGPAALWR